MFSTLGFDHCGELPLRQLEKSVHPLIDIGALNGGRRFLAREQLRDVRLCDLSRGRKVALFQAQFFKSLFDEKTNVHERAPLRLT